MKSKSNLKSETIHLRCTKKEKKILLRNAGTKPLSEYMLQRSLAIKTQHEELSKMATEYVTMCQAFSELCEMIKLHGDNTLNERANQMIEKLRIKLKKAEGSNDHDAWEADQ